MDDSIDRTPFAEAPWLTGVPSPYYSESHKQWQRTCRAFISENLGDHGLQWMRDGKASFDMYAKFAAAGMLIPSLPAPLPVERLKQLGVHELPGGLRLEQFDYFHYLIYTSELYYCGLWAPAGMIIPGMAFGTPPLLHYGSEELQNRLLPELLLGKTRACIAVTEPGAGSDVANIETTAVKSTDGSHYIVNGYKKWISTGIWADYATTAVRTGGPGASGISLMMVPLKNTSGVTCRSMTLSNGQVAGTTFIEFDDVRVPVGNLIGKEGLGLKYILTNFNHERMSMVISALVQARKVLSTTFAYCSKRQAFGKRLIDQPVVRNRLAKAGSMLEAEWARAEQLTHGMNTLPKAESDTLLGGLIAMAKVAAAKTLEHCISHAQVLLGGNSVTRSGQGELIEAISREVGLSRVPGGSEDVLLDLSVRELLKRWEKLTKAAAQSHKL
ncbi:putative acyl-CoA dehydrogenase 6 [Cercospora beticola]|nr:putative acyl-CoA dehydrogenase 6 [Cercospora beticola]PIA92954.1 putative acyl-CoA dehydrogenase 6 [Cercospora beticola]